MLEEMEALIENDGCPPPDGLDDGDADFERDGDALLLADML